VEWAVGTLVNRLVIPLLRLGGEILQSKVARFDDQFDSGLRMLKKEKEIVSTILI